MALVRNHGTPVSVERRAEVVSDLTSDLLAVRSIRPAPEDPHVAMLRRDIPRGRSQCIAHLVAVLWSDGEDGIPLERLLSFGRSLNAELEADFSTVSPRDIPQLQELETELDTTLDRVQMALANGCRSSRTLDGGIEAIDQLLPVLEELRSAFVREKHRKAKTAAR